MGSFIDGHLEDYGVEPICSASPLALSTYYERKARQADPSRLPHRAQRGMALSPENEPVWRENSDVYAPRKAWFIAMARPMLPTPGVAAVSLVTIGANAGTQRVRDSYSTISDR